MASAAATTQPRRVCASCGSNPGTLRCAKCKARWFCSQPCQRADWPTHKVSCKAPAARARATVQPAVPPLTPPLPSPSAPLRGGPPAHAARQTDSDLLSSALPSLRDLGVAEFFADDAVPLALTQTRRGGRHLVAKGDLPEGVMVLAADRYAAVPRDGCAATTCHHCFAASATHMVRCSRCKFAVFCDRECMGAAARQHRAECGALRALNAAEVAFDGDADFATLIATSALQAAASLSNATSAPDGDVDNLGGGNSSGSRDLGEVDPTADKEGLRLLVAVLARRQLEAEDGPAPPAARGVRHSWVFGDVADLQAHAEEVRRRDARAWRALMRGAEAVAAALNEVGAGAGAVTGGGARADADAVTAGGTPAAMRAPRVSSADVAGLLLRIRVNAHPIMDDASQAAVGLGLFPGACYLNHSCAPNTVVHAGSGGRVVVARTIRPIPRGAAATYAYIDQYQPTPQRLAMLHNAYLFDCDCAACAAPQAQGTDPYSLLTAGACPSAGGRSAEAAATVPATGAGAGAGATVDAGAAGDASKVATCPGPLLAPTTSDGAPPSGGGSRWGAMGRCATCGATQPASRMVDAARETAAALRHAMQLSQVDALGAHRRLTALAAADATLALHPCHRLRFSLHVALVGTAAAVRDHAARAVHAEHALRCIQRVCPTAVRQAAAMASARAFALVLLSKGGEGRGDGVGGSAEGTRARANARARACEAVSFAEAALRLCYGGDHLQVARMAAVASQLK